MPIDPSEWEPVSQPATKLPALPSQSESEWEAVGGTKPVRKPPAALPPVRLPNQPELNFAAPYDITRGVGAAEDALGSEFKQIVPTALKYAGDISRAVPANLAARVAKSSGVWRQYRCSASGAADAD